MGYKNLAGKGYLLFKKWDIRLYVIVNVKKHIGGNSLWRKIL